MFEVRVKDEREKRLSHLSEQFKQLSLIDLYDFGVAIFGYLTIRLFALKGYGSIAHEAKPNGLLTRGP